MWAKSGDGWPCEEPSEAMLPWIQINRSLPEGERTFWHSHSTSRCDNRGKEIKPSTHIPNQHIIQLADGYPYVTPQIPSSTARPPQMTEHAVVKFGNDGQEHCGE